MDEIAIELFKAAEKKHGPLSTNMDQDYVAFKSMYMPKQYWSKKSQESTAHTLLH